MKFSAKGLLFDNDGVLVDSLPAAVAAWNEWSATYAPGWNWGEAENSGVRAQDMVLRMVGEARFAEANDLINRLELETASNTVPMPGAIELTSSLAPGNWTVCTSAIAALGRARLQAAGIPIPRELVTGDDVANGKPDPEPYLLGAARLGLEPEDCVVFEDALAGCQAAFDAGVGLIVGVSESALDTPADIVVRDLSGITFDGQELYIPDRNRLR